MATILAVDDSATMRKCLEITFKGTGINLVSCETASDALEKVKTLGPDLVLADVSLPPGDGYELCSTIKLAAPNLPVLLLASKQNPFDPVKGKHADDHIDKPFDTQKLFDKARDMIEQGVIGKPPGDTDIPTSFADQPSRPPTGAGSPVIMPERGAPAGGRIPAPSRKRPTPAMMSSPIAPPVTSANKGEPIRRTVPFAIPGTGPGGDPKKTAPGMSDPAAAPARQNLSKTMAMPGKLEAAATEALQRAVGAPRQATARGAESSGSPGARPKRGTFPGVPAITDDDVGLPPHDDGDLPVPPAPESPAPITAEYDLDGALARPRRPTVSSWPAPAAPAGLAAGGNGAFEDKLRGLGLSEDQVNGVLAISRDVVERVVWEVVPTLAETIIKEELARLTSE